jgi:hypothetical protein
MSVLAPHLGFRPSYSPDLEYQANYRFERGAKMASRVKKKACVRNRHVLMSQRQIDSDLIRIRFNADWIDRGNEVRNLLQRIRILNLRNSDM